LKAERFNEEISLTAWFKLIAACGSFDDLNLLLDGVTYCCEFPVLDVP